MRVRVRVRRRGGRNVTDESGATILIVAVALMALMGMVVLVVDVGGLLTLRRQMVTVSDAAALAAAQSCAKNAAGEASSQATSLATQNNPDATQENFETTNCGTSSEGTVEVEYSAPKTLAFAPIFGYPEERPVSATAHAIWGPTGGDTPMPIEFAIDSAGTIPCVYQEIGTKCNYWWDNSSDHDLNDNSNWGFMNLSTAGIAPDASCPNSGTDDRRDWIDGVDKAPLTVTPPHTYVCVDSGHSNSSWFAALQAQVGKIKRFPVNDPDAMIRIPGKEKYAVIGFVALKVEGVYRGNDPAAVGIPGASGHCSTTRSFTNGSTFDVDTIGCYSGNPSVSNLVLTGGRGSRRTTFVEGTHYTFDPTTHVIRWFSGNRLNVSINFDWAQAGSEGACGSRSPDPNAVCLVASWQGVQVGGSLPGSGADFGLRAVRLDG